MNFILNLLATAIATFLLGKYILPGVQIDDFGSAIIFSLILGIVNAIIKPILTFLTIPITFITLGLFLLVINALMILLADSFVVGINVDSFWWAFIFSILLSFLSSFIADLFGVKEE